MMRHEDQTTAQRAGTHASVWWKRKRLYVLLPLILGLVWTLYVWLQIHSAESSLRGKTDVGIILGASMWGDHPSPGLRERLEHGLKLYNEGHFPVMIVTGGLDKPGYKYTEAEGMRNWLVSNGVPENAIVLENEATSTYENLLYSQRIMEEKGMKKAAIITHDFHGSRAMEVADALQYKEPVLSITTSSVLPMAKYKGREILAYTKWTADRLLLALGLK